MNRLFSVLLLVSLLPGMAAAKYYKNVGSKVYFYAWDTASDAPKTGDAANLTAYVSIDGAAEAALTDTSAAEVDATNCPGSYVFDTSNAEMNGSVLLFTCKSSTASIYLAPATIAPDEMTSAAMANLLAFFDGTGYAGGTIKLTTDVTKIAGAAVDPTAAQIGVNVVNWKGAAAAAMTGDAYARVGAPVGASLSADIAATAAEIAKVPKSDGTVSWNSTALAAILAQFPIDPNGLMESVIHGVSPDAGIMAAEDVQKSVRTELEKAPDADPNAGSIMATNVKLASMIESDGSTGWELTGGALVNAPTGTGGFTEADRDMLTNASNDANAIDTGAELRTLLAGSDTALATAAQATAIETDTQDLQAQIGTDGAGLTAIGDSRMANLDATVSSRSSHDAAAVKTAVEANGSKLDSIYDKLPSKDFLTGTANSDGDIQANEATGNFPGTVAKSAATLAAGDVTGNLPADVKAYTTQPTVTGATLDAAYDAAKTAAQPGVDGDTLKTLSDQIDALNDLSSVQAQAAAAAALAAYDVPTEAQMNARTLAAADYFDPAADTVTADVDVDESAIASAVAAGMLAEEIDGVSWETILEAQLADLCGRVAVSGTGSTRTYTYYKRDNTTVIMTITVTVPSGARSAAGTIGED